MDNTKYFNTRKAVIFYLYAQYLNQDTKKEEFLDIKVDEKYFHQLLSIYNQQLNVIKKNILFILRKNELNVLDIIILSVMFAENSLLSFTKKDLRDYKIIANNYCGTLLVKLIIYFKEENILKFAL